MRGIWCLGTAFLCLGIGLLAGCGGSDEVGGRLAVSGTVYYKGEAVNNGAIEFHPTAGQKTFSGAGIMGGKFSIPADKGLEPGAYAIKITWPDAAPPAEPGGLPGKESKERLPDKYNTKSTLTKEVKRGETKFDFKLD